MLMEVLQLIWRVTKKVIQKNILAVKKFNFKWKGMNEAY